MGGDDKIKAMLEKQSPAQIATGELMVLKNTIKKFVKGGDRAKILRLANSVIGSKCGRVSSGSLGKFQSNIEALKKLAKSNDPTGFESSLKKMSF